MANSLLTALTALAPDGGVDDDEGFGGGVTDRNDAIAKQNLMYDMIVLALQTDSTRTITFQLSGMNAVPVIPGVSSDWHGLSHHGKDPAKIDALWRDPAARDRRSDS